MEKDHLLTQIVNGFSIIKQSLNQKAVTLEVCIFYFSSSWPKANNMCLLFSDCPFSPRSEQEEEEKKEKESFFDWSVGRRAKWRSYKRRYGFPLFFSFLLFFSVLKMNLLDTRLIPPLPFRLIKFNITYKLKVL